MSTSLFASFLILPYLRPFPVCLTPPTMPTRGVTIPTLDPDQESDFQLVDDLDPDSHPVNSRCCEILALDPGSDF